MLKYCLILIGAAGVSGCVNTSIVSPLDLLPATCTPVNVPPNCSNAPGGPNAPRLNFNTNTPLNVAPPNVCARKNKTLKIKITPTEVNGQPRKKGTVSVVPKDLTNTWLIGSNSDDADEIVIPIPGHISIGKYEYALIVNDTDGLRCLDPRVHVEN